MFCTQAPHPFTKMTWNNVWINAHAVMFHLRISRSILQSFVNKARRYLNSFTQGTITLTPHKVQSTGFWQRTVLLQYVCLSSQLCHTWLQNDPVCWRSESDKNQQNHITCKKHRSNFRVSLNGQTSHRWQEPWSTIWPGQNLHPSWIWCDPWVTAWNVLQSPSLNLG